MPEYVQYNAQGLIINKWYSADPSVVEGLTNILQIPRDVFNSLTEYKVVDNGAVRDMTQAERDIYDAWKLSKVQQAETDRLAALDDSMVAIQTTRLTKIETMIDNIGSLADAKIFLKRLVRYISTLPRN